MKIAILTTLHVTVITILSAQFGGLVSLVLLVCGAGSLLFIVQELSKEYIIPMCRKGDCVTAVYSPTGGVPSGCESVCGRVMLWKAIGVDTNGHWTFKPLDTLGRVIETPLGCVPADELRFI